MKIRNKQTGQIIEVTEDQLADYGLDTMAKGGMIKRADGSYSRRGLWDNIRANKGSGKKPTKAMLAQEKKIRAAEKAYGGYMDMGGYMNPYMNYGGYMASGGCMECGGKMQVGGTAKPSYDFPALMEKPTAMDSAVYRSNFNQMLKQDPYAVSQYQKMQKYGIPPTLDNETYTKALMWQNAYEDALSKLKKKESGGKLPKEVLLPRLESHMSPKQAHDYLNTYGMGGYLDEAGDGKWIQKATASIKKRGTEGKCTPITKPGCTGKAKTLAKTFRKMAKNRKADGGYTVGSQHEMDDVQIAKLRAMGYKIKEV